MITKGAGIIYSTRLKKAGEKISKINTLNYGEMNQASISHSIKKCGSKFLAMLEITPINSKTATHYFLLGDSSLYTGGSGIAKKIKMHIKENEFQKEER